jgi:hypothetical protein
MLSLTSSSRNKENSLKNVREQSAKQGKEFSGIDSMFQMVKKAFDAKSTELERKTSIPSDLISILIQQQTT